MAPVSGWRFSGLGTGGDGRGAGQGPAVTPAGGIALVTGDAAVRQSLILLLSTTPGERVMRPDYGCPLHRLMFWPNDATTAGLAIHYVRQAVQRWEPRIEILRLDAGRSATRGEASEESPSTLFVWLDYRVRATQRTDQLSLTLDLAGDRH
jgi:phage baseplate assembly protein W